MYFENIEGQEFFSPIYARRNLYHCGVIREWEPDFAIRFVTFYGKNMVKTCQKLK